MNKKDISRREFLRTSMGIAAGASTMSLSLKSFDNLFIEEKPAVSIVRIKNENISFAVEEAIDLLGGIKTITKGKEKIMLKPNLVDHVIYDTTKPRVVGTLAQLMKKAGKEVLIGEGSAAATGFNVKDGVQYRTKNREILDKMQQFVFDTLGYTELAKSMGIPLINLHSGEMAEVEVPDGFVFDKITLHRSLTDIDMLCSVPMMKTHGLATVTLGMKNLIGAYPGMVYYSVRTEVHNRTAEIEPSGTAAAVVDMVRANKLGLVVIDGLMAMEGDGPSVSFGGKLILMNLIIAGTNPLATDIVAANIMGFEPTEIPTFIWAEKAGMKPTTLDEIEIRGEKLENVRRPFIKPNVAPWAAIKDFFGAQEVGAEPGQSANVVSACPLFGAK
jgi:uncharacterized protein (DUF362 family)